MSSYCSIKVILLNFLKKKLFMMEKFLVFTLVFIQIYTIGHSLTCYKCQPNEGETTCKENMNNVCDDASKCYNIEGLTLGQSMQVSVDYHTYTLTAGRGCVPVTATTITTAVVTTTNATTSITSTTMKKLSLSAIALSTTTTMISLTPDNDTLLINETFSSVTTPTTTSLVTTAPATTTETITAFTSTNTTKSPTSSVSTTVFSSSADSIVKSKRSVFYAHYKRDVNLENTIIETSSTMDEIPINVTIGCNNFKFNETFTIRLCLCDTENCNSATTLNHFCAITSTLLVSLVLIFK